ncbi:hypothetical protein 031MP004_89 [Bacillus phage 031MP004]|nr:hypothetical protein 031MP003_91 [Bacillus phage 031MP003]QFG05666.1 hypothetical protein 031MP004_89 [Bacillus phage 031MP004]
MEKKFEGVVSTEEQEEEIPEGVKRMYRELAEHVKRKGVANTGHPVRKL